MRLFQNPSGLPPLCIHDVPKGRVSPFHGPLQMGYYQVGKGAGLPKIPILGHHAPWTIQKG